MFEHELLQPEQPLLDDVPWHDALHSEQPPPDDDEVPVQEAAHCTQPTALPVQVVVQVELQPSHVVPTEPPLHVAVQVELQPAQVLPTALPSHVVVQVELQPVQALLPEEDMQDDEQVEQSGAPSSFSQETKLLPNTMAPNMGNVPFAAFLKNSLLE